MAYSSLWFPKEQQGTAVGIFCAGNVGAALTTFFAPSSLNNLTNYGANIEGWRSLPKLYAALLLVTAIIFLLATKNKLPAASKTMLQRLLPLKETRVWRFGLYYFFVFGGFVALSQWLIPYYVNVYSLTIVAAGFMAAAFFTGWGYGAGSPGRPADSFGPQASPGLSLSPGCPSSWESRCPKTIQAAREMIFGGIV